MALRHSSLEGVAGACAQAWTSSLDRAQMHARLKADACTLSGAVADSLAMRAVACGGQRPEMMAAGPSQHPRRME